MENAATAQEPSEVDVEELVNVFCDIHTTPVRAAQRMQVRCDICGEVLSGLVLFHMTEKHEAMVESFLTSVEELEGSVDGHGVHEGVRAGKFESVNFR